MFTAKIRIAMSPNLQTDHLTDIFSFWNGSAVERSNSTRDDWLNESQLHQKCIDRATFQFIMYVIIVPILFGSITLVGIIGNILVIYVILSKNQMCTATNLLLLNLAVADLCFVAVIPPVTAYDFGTRRWLLGDVPCKLMHYVVNVTAYVTVYTLVLVSALRYMTVVHSVSTVRIRTRRNIVATILIVWLMMLALNIPVMFAYQVRTGRCHQKCDITPDKARMIFATFFVFAYLLPLSIIAMFSLGILRYIAKHRLPTLAVADRSNRSSAKKRQASRLLVLVVVIFAVLWLPVHAHLLAYYTGAAPESGVYEVFSVFCVCLMYFNSCVNPIIYNHTSKDFRDAFHEVLCCCRPGTDETGTEMVNIPTPRTAVVHAAEANLQKTPNCAITEL